MISFSGRVLYFVQHKQITKTSNIKLNGYTQTILVVNLTLCSMDCISGVMVIMLDSRVVDRGFES